MRSSAHAAMCRHNGSQRRHRGLVRRRYIYHSVTSIYLGGNMSGSRPYSQRSHPLETGCLVLATFAFATCLLVLSRGPSSGQSVTHGRYAMSLSGVRFSFSPRLTYQPWSTCGRDLLGVWDEQHPGPGDPFVWSSRNILAIAAACVVRAACHCL